MDPTNPREHPLPPGIPANPTESLVPGAWLGSLDSVRTEDLIESLGSEGDRPGSPLFLPRGPAYRLLQRVGVGGMGEVWEALQVSLNRTVAVKRINPGAADAQLDARKVRNFRIEGLIAGRLEHPNIVPVHDMAFDAGDSPLLAMKLVEGERWDSVICRDFVQQTPEDFLAGHIPILISVAQAVAYAHSRGVIHRDLKPSQVMLGAYGEVMLTDWGLAILMESEESGNATVPGPDGLELPTNRTGQSPAGTPALMPPEQTDDTATNTGPWSDVYLLGSVLFYLLTGRFPHSADTGAESFRKAIGGVVSRPSTVAPHRQVPRDLEDLCLSCLEPDWRRRVMTARDVIHHLEDYLRGRTRRRESEAITDEVARTLESSPGTYETYTSCLTRLSSARTAWSRNPAARELREHIRIRFAEKALSQGDLSLAQFQADGIEDPECRDQLLGRIAAERQRHRQRARHLRQARTAAVILGAIVVLGGLAFTLRLHAQARRVESSYRLSEQRRITAEERAGEARAARARTDALVDFMVSDMRRRLAPYDPELRAARELVARAAEHVESLAMDVSTLENPEVDRLFQASCNIAEILYLQGDSGRGRKHFDWAVSVARARAGRDPAWRNALVSSLMRRGVALSESGDLDDAIASLQEARRLAGDDAGATPGDRAAATRLVRIQLALATAMAGHGDRITGDREIQSASHGIAQLLRSAPGDAALLRLRADVDSCLGDLLVRGGRYPEAKEAFGRARDTVLALSQAAPDDADLRVQLCTVSSSYGDRLKGEGHTREALEEFRQNLDRIERLLDSAPGNLAYIDLLATAWLQCGDAQRDLGLQELAAGSYEAGIAASRRKVLADPNNLTFVAGYSTALDRMTELLVAAGRPAEALRYSVEAGEVLGGAAGRLETQARGRYLRRRLALQGMNHGALLLRLGRPVEALPVLDEAIAVQSQLNREAPGNVAWHDNLGQLHATRGRAFALLRDPFAASEAMAWGAAEYRTLRNHGVADGDWQDRECLLMVERAAVLRQVGDLSSSMELIRSARELLDSYRSTKLPGRLRLHEGVIVELAENLRVLGSQREALDALDAFGAPWMIALKAAEEQPTPSPEEFAAAALRSEILLDQGDAGGALAAAMRVTPELPVGDAGRAGLDELASDGIARLLVALAEACRACGEEEASGFFAAEALARLLPMPPESMPARTLGLRVRAAGVVGDRDEVERCGIILDGCVLEPADRGRVRRALGG